MHGVPTAQRGIPHEGKYISLNYVRVLLDHMRERQIDVAPMMRAMGLSDTDLLDPDVYIDPALLPMAFEAAEALSGDGHIGLHAGQTMKSAHLGALGHLLLSCTCTQELFDLHTRYSALIGNTTRCEYLDYGHETVMMVHHRHPVVAGRQFTEFNLAGWLTLARWLAGEHFIPTLVELNFAQPADNSGFAAFARCPVQYEAPQVRVHFDRHIFSARFAHAVAGLRSLLEAELDRRLPPVSDDVPPVLHDIHQRLGRMLPKGSPSLTALAQDMKLSARRLQRMLDAHQTSFRALTDAVRQRLALAYVADRKLSLVEVSVMVGYTEQSTFQRAFKRWTGYTPGEYRAQRIGERALMPSSGDQAPSTASSRSATPR